ncbi:TRAF family member-associated NF-kappa-B activator [Bagarius yarrelli]|uniref:TRAF family member-associated NF-kappa-B activator n=1 Tax=Bagarius yarrelli TaxID=175774 RepID=A0A556V4J9_BAGYA|nr:TRAF family member-associated NF-kappa-B activator [Bagarius yarrelli]
MEEAYTALYQEFLRLQLLCLKQAEMLQHLTEALRRQQDVSPVFNGHVEELHSELVQCRRDSLHLESVQKKEKVDGAAAGQCGKEERSILDELRQVEQCWHNSQRPQQQQQQPQRNVYTAVFLRSLCGNAAVSPQRPWSSSFLTSEMLSDVGGMLMSRVTLQSRVCEFCHAVFPGHTTTRGEFLRHLTTHIS